MTRWLLKAVDVGASAVFVALCAKAFCILFVEDIKQQLRVRKPSLSAVDALKQAEMFGQRRIVRIYLVEASKSPTIEECLEHARQCEWYAARTNDEKTANSSLGWRIIGRSWPPRKSRKFAPPRAAA